MVASLAFLFCVQARLMKKPGREDKIAVVVGAITDDIRIHTLPKLKVVMNVLIIQGLLKVLFLGCARACMCGLTH